MKGGITTVYSRRTSLAFLSSRSAMNRLCRRCTSSVHSTNSNCATSTGFSHNVECRTMPHRLLPVLSFLRSAPFRFGIISCVCGNGIVPRLLTSVNAMRLIVLCFQVSGSKQEEELSLVRFDQPDGRVDCGTNFAFGKRREP